METIPKMGILAAFLAICSIANTGLYITMKFIFKDLWIYSWLDSEIVVIGFILSIILCGSLVIWIVDQFD